MPSELQTERRGTTLVLTISDPSSRNTLSAQVIAAGIEALSVAESNPEVRAVVLQGAAGHFSAGGNVHGLIERRAAGEAAQRRMLEDLRNVIVRHNYMDGGNYTINAGGGSGADGYAKSNYVFSGNVFGHHARYGVIQGLGAGISFDATNVWVDTGLAVQ